MEEMAAQSHEHDRGREEDSASFHAPDFAKSQHPASLAGHFRIYLYVHFVYVTVLSQLVMFALQKLIFYVFCVWLFFI